MTDPKEEIDSNIIIVGGFNTPLSLMDRTTTQKLKRLEQHCKSSEPNRYIQNIPLRTEYAFFLRAYETSSRITHMLDHKTLINLKRLKPYKVFFKPQWKETRN